MDRHLRFQAVWACFVPVPAGPAWRALQGAYAEAGRAYHNWRHIDAMLAGMDAVRSDAEFSSTDFAAIELAIFFHDAVYDPTAKDNEARSAELLGQMAGTASSALQNVQEMILATATHAPSQDVATRLLLDLDLAVLGGEPAAYRAYARAVREEYAAVPDAIWTSGRAAVLGRFLERPALYQTSSFHRKLEAAARRNISDEIEALRSTGSGR